MVQACRHAHSLGPRRASLRQGARPRGPRAGRHRPTEPLLEFLLRLAPPSQRRPTPHGTIQAAKTQRHPVPTQRALLLPRAPRPARRRPHLRPPQRRPPHRRHRLPHGRRRPEHPRARRHDRALHLPVRRRGRPAHERAAGGDLWEHGCVSPAC